MMKFKISAKCLVLLVPLVVFITYYFYLPIHLQGGDTSELVSAAYFNLVAHPPGYPLWSFLQNHWIHLIPHKSIFWRASLLNSLFSLGSLFFVSSLLRQHSFLLCVFTITLAFTPSFFQMAVLPDVFSLHVLIVSAICFLYINQNISAKVRSFGVPFLFFVGISNHHTIVFLFPVILDFFYEHWRKRDGVKWLVWGTGLGIVLTVVLYLTILLKNTSSYYSWGNIETLETLWRHFLRVDYGTFQLSASEQRFNFNWFSIYYFFKVHFLSLISLSVLLLLKIRYRLSLLVSRKSLTLITSIGFSLFFLGMANFPIEGMGKEIISRFHLMPFVLIVFWMILNWRALDKNKVRINPSAKFIIAVLVLYLSTTGLIRNKDLARDSLFEDYAGSLLKGAKENSASVIFTSNDNLYFALRYLKLLNLDFDSVAIVSPPLIFHEWYVEKLEKVLPKFKIINKNQVFNQRKMDLDRDVLSPNIQNYSYLFAKSFQDSKNFKITYLSLGRLVSEGSGVFFQPNIADPKFDYGKLETIFNSFQGFSKKYILADYSHYYLAQGLEFYSTANKAEALKAWRKAIKIVPYCYPAYLNICAINNSKEVICQKENLERIRRESEFIF